ANAEAVSHFTKGLELLGSMPDSTERIQRELGLQMALGGALMAIKSQAAPEAGKAYTRALELCRRLGETPRLFPVLGALSVFHLAQGELRSARDLVEQLLRLAQNLQTPALLQVAHFGWEWSVFVLESSSTPEHIWNERLVSTIPRSVASRHSKI